MPQARRIKAKPKDKKKANTSKRNIPWGLMLVVVVTGSLLYKLYIGAQTGDGIIGSGLNELLKKHETTSDEETRAIKDLVAKSTEKEFDFYEVLPDIEKVMPNDLADPEPDESRPETEYYVQAASFRKHADAERLRARLALKGFKSSTYTRTSAERGTFYRVRLGPFDNKRQAESVKNKLQAIGVQPMVTSVAKNK
ncbi:MAG: SPOR domain-containing protein [Gammaproteobacteria bacterium]|nr:SPOR domain-containing protein [Gammaproteobacteria bacterium]